MQTTISQWGNSNALRLPKSVVNQLYINIGDKVDIDIKDDNIIIKPLKKKSNLDELLSQMPDNYQAVEVFDDICGQEVI
jgi:antitoxin component of MazEF toxin-antitoxin module